MWRALNYLLPSPEGHPQRGLFLAYGIVVVGALLGAVAYDNLLMAAMPLALLVLAVAVVDFHKLFFLMMACIPFSMEKQLPGGLGTDLPSEPLMWLLTLAGIGWLLRHGRSIDGRFVRHPVTLALFVHLAWMTVSVAASQDWVVSVKFLLAKGWYVVVFYFLAARILQEERHYKSLVWWFFVPLLITVLVTLVRHAPTGFSFDSVNFIMGPFYRNHVIYACIQAIFLPFVWFATYWYRRGSAKHLLLAGGLLIFLAGINFAYTRAAYVALVAAVGIHWMVRRRRMKLALAGATLALAVLVGIVAHRDNWLEFAPDYQHTVTHKRFDRLLEATTKLQDISTMERVYRWVAASYMLQDRPLMGFGPGNFYFFYKNYTVSSFQTYVSDNPERSGMHNYYLMTAVEQGIPGAVIFIGFCFFALLRGEKIYHRTIIPWRRRMVSAALLCFALIVMLMLMNDFVETDKIGALFFISLAILVNMDLSNPE